MPGPIPVVPSQAPQQSELNYPNFQNPFNGVWFADQTITDVPPHAVGWLVANGWSVTRTVRDTTTVPPTVYYDMQTSQLDPLQALLFLCNSFTLEAQYARDANEIRYNDVVRNWTEAIETTQAHAAEETKIQNDCMGVYIADLNMFMTEIDDLLTTNRGSLDAAHAKLETNTNERLDGLGQTELARINEHFSATLSVQLQRLIDQGLHNTAVAADITARNERDRDEQIQQLNDRLNRERLQNDHQLYAASTSLSQFKQQAILSKMQVRVAQLEGFKQVHDDNMRLMAYQLDTRNQLLVGLYSFVERREDVGPQWENMATMIASLGEAGGGSWITP